MLSDIAKYMFFLSLVFLAVATGDMHVTAITLAAMYLDCSITSSDRRAQRIAREIVLAAQGGEM